jgi:hypothetical protein
MVNKLTKLGFPPSRERRVFLDMEKLIFRNTIASGAFEAKMLQDDRPDWAFCLGDYF